MLHLRHQFDPYLKYGKVLHLQKNAVIYRQGEKGEGFYYLDQGGVKIVVLSHNGQERIVDYVPVGSLLGEHGAGQSAYLTSAYTTSASVLYSFSIETLTRMFKDHPESGLLFINSLIFKVRLLAERIAFHDSPVEQQLAHYLLKLTHIHENESISIDQTSLASYIGTSRITVNKMIQKWKNLGLLTFSPRRMMQIPDRNKLRAILAPANRKEEQADQRNTSLGRL